MAKLSKAEKKAIMDKMPVTTGAELEELGIATGEGIFLPPFDEGGEFGKLTIGEMVRVARTLKEQKKLG